MTEGSDGYLPEVDSTSDEIRRRLAAGHPTKVPMRVWTTVQTAGHGQRGRTWRAPPGNLSASWWLPGPPRDAWTTHRAGIVVLAAAARMGVELGECGLKWVNDLVHVPAEGTPRKWGGILAESPGPAGIILGIGINLVPPDWPEATWVGAFSNCLPPAESWMAALQAEMTVPRTTEQVRQEYARSCRTLGRQGIWLCPDGTTREGTFTALLEDGGLCMQDREGHQHTIRTGPVRGLGDRYM